MSEELKDYTALDINEFLVSDTSVLTEYEQTDALAFDQSFEGVPGGNIIFGGMQIRKKKYSDTTTSGVWVGVDTDGIGKINIGDGTNFLLWNGSSLVISGDLTATSGTIGGWTIGATTLASDRVILDSGGSIQILDASSVVRAESFINGWEFSNEVGGTSGSIYIDPTFDNFYIQASQSDLSLISDTGDITFITGGSIQAYMDATDFVLSGVDLKLGSTTIIGGGSWTMTLPSTNGTSGQFLQTNGSGVTTWASAAASGADTDLNNLVTTSINQSLIPADSVVDLGSSSLPWDRGYIDDVYLTNGDGGIYYNANLALDFYATRIELGSTYSDFSPATSLSSNLGSTNRWNDFRVDTIDATGDIDTTANMHCDGLRLLAGTAHNPAVEGEITFYDSGSIQYRGQVISTDYSFDLTAA